MRRRRQRFEFMLIAALALAVPASAQLIQDGIFRFHRGQGCGLDRQENSPNASFTLGDCIGSSFPGSGTMGITVTAPETITGTLIPDTFLMQLVTPITTSATATTTGKVIDDKSREPYSVVLTVTTFNAATRVGLLPSQICRKQVRADNVKAGASVTLTATNQCTWTELGLGYRGEGGPVGFQETEVEMHLFDKDGAYRNRYGGEINTLYAFLPRIDELVLFSVTPTSQPLAPDTEVDFTGRVSVLLRTRKNADLALRLVDDSGNLHGSSDFVRINSSFAATEHALTIPKVKIPGTPRLHLKAVLIDRLSASVFKETSVKSFNVATRCALEGILQTRFAFDTWWLPDLPVELIDTSTSNVVATTMSRPDPLRPEVKSFYCFNPSAGLDPGKQYRVRVRLHDGAAPINAKLMIFDRPDAPAPSEIQWKPFGVSGARGNRKDLIVRAGGDLDVPDPLSTTGAAATYWHLWQQIYELWPKMFPGRPLRGDLPVEVYLNGTPTSYYCPIERLPECRSASSITLFRDSSLPGSHPDVLRHEFGHHVIRELYGIGLVVPPEYDPSDTQRRSLSHGGYSNSYTSDSINEGFATFWAVVGNRILDGDAGGVMTVNGLSSTGALNPTHTGLSLEQNWPAWFHRRASDADPPQSPPREELSVAGILWDLVDTPGDAEPHADVKWGAFSPADSITVAPEVIMQAIAADIPNTLVELRSILINRLPAAMTRSENNPRRSGLSQLDEIFVMHRVFHDNGDWKYQLGETIGKPANGATWLGSDAEGKQPLSIPARPWRESVRKITGSNIRIELKDASGNVIDAGEVKVSFEFGAGFEHFNSTRMVPVQNGLLYFEMPPDHYPVRAVITVPGSTQEPLVIENASYWPAVAIATEQFAQKTFVFPKPAVTSLQPSSGAAGTTVVITGAGFSQIAPDNAVRFGDERAEVTAASPAGLTVVVPPAASGTPAVTVTVAGQQSNSMTFNVTLRGIEVTTTAITFGVISTGTSADRAITIRNTGSAAVTVQSIRGSTPVFSLVSPAAPFTIAPGATQTATVRFSPTAAGDFTTDLIVTSDDQARPQIMVYATAIAIRPLSPDIDIAPHGLNFGAVTPGANRTMSFALRNQGSAPLNVNAISITSPQFSVVSPSPPFSVEAGAEQDVVLRFAPSATGVQTATLTVANNDTTAPAVVIRLRGEGGAGSADAILSTDDGSLETAVAGNGVIVVNRLTPASYPATLKTIRLFLYQFPNQPNPTGAQIQLIAFAGAPGTNQPPIGPQVLFVQTVSVPAVTTAGAFFDFPVSGSATINGGDFYVGYRSPNPSAGVVYAADSNGPQQQRGFFSTDGGVTYQGPLVAAPSSGGQIPVNILIRAVISTGAAASTCTFGVTPLSHGLGGGAGSAAIAVTAPSGCGWNAVANVPWITFTAASGTGNGEVRFSVAANDGSQRTGVISIADFSVEITQSGGRRRPLRR
ncbi:MAG TPA: choice-of-anchor D domain-containing protein [Thermoanaerobaculia bacterium]|nr:choice-of-anchor D domain-containing protein [Thermoanaerobaculia bacterium]